MSEWVKAGQIGVDAGLCWIGDPCYVLHEKPKEIGKNWHDFCDKVFSGDFDNDFYTQIGKLTGVCVATGYGDGLYPVYVRYGKEGRIEAAKVVFIPRDRDEQEDEDQ